MSILQQAQTIANWLRFERQNSGPCYIPEIENATGIKITPSLSRVGEDLGLFRFSNAHGSFI